MNFFLIYYHIAYEPLTEYLVIPNIPTNLFHSPHAHDLIVLYAFSHSIYEERNEKL